MSLWAKLHVDVLNDTKLLRAARRGAKGLEFLPWLFAWAKRANDNGRLTYGGHVSAAADIAAEIPGAARAKVQSCLDALASEDMGVLARDEDGAFRLVKWPERQYTKPSDTPEQARERKRKERMSRDVTPDVTPTVTRRSRAFPPIEERGEREEVRETTTTSHSLRAREAEAEFANHLLTEADRSALATLMGTVSNAETWLDEMRAGLTGMDGHTLVTPAQLGDAIRDYVGNGAAKRPNLRQFRRYLERATEALSATNGRSNHRPRGGVAARTYANAQRALEDLP